MRIAQLIARHIEIPLRKPIKHASHERTSTDNLLIECRLDNGIVGYGEGVPRDYVTGETIDTAFATLRRSPLAAWAQQDPKTLTEVIDVAGRLELTPEGVDSRQIAANAVRCAVELAYLDACTRTLQVPLSAVTQAACPELFEPKPEVRYSVAITSATGWKLRFQALIRKWFGFRQCKVKVGITGQDDVARLRTIRRLMGPKMELQLDANEAWTVAECEARWNELSPYDIAWVEQPVAHEAIGDLANVRRTFKMPVMLDESLCGMSDAENCVREGWGDWFNLRLSKCGGFLNSLRLAAFAYEHGLGCQLGCQVGETAVLSAAGRHFACSVRGLRALEGSFDRWLVRESLGTRDITFRRGGLAPALSGPGLGIELDPQAVERVTRRREVVVG